MNAASSRLIVSIGVAAAAAAMGSPFGYLPDFSVVIIISDCCVAERMNASRHLRVIRSSARCGTARIIAASNRSKMRI